MRYLFYKGRGARQVAEIEAGVIVFEDYVTLNGTRYVRRDLNGEFVCFDEVEVPPDGQKFAPKWQAVYNGAPSPVYTSQAFESLKARTPTYQRIQRLEDELVAVKIERDTLRQAGDNALAKIDQLRDQRDRLLAKVEKYENGHHPNDGCAREIASLKKQLEGAHLGLTKQRDDANTANAALRDEVVEVTAAADFLTEKVTLLQQQMHHIYLITIDAEDKK